LKKTNEQKVKEVEDKLDGKTKLRCAHCIQESITEGMWDRFGTTAQQELEATCDKHLVEAINFYLGKGVPEWDRHAAKLAAEQERRKSSPC
jgi:hypothetical protein